jgi:hypothetical protein
MFLLLSTFEPLSTTFHHILTKRLFVFSQYFSCPNRKSLIKAYISEKTENRFQECFWTAVITSLYCQSTHTVICTYGLCCIICCLRCPLVHCVSLTSKLALATSFPILQYFLLHLLQSPVRGKTNSGLEQRLRTAPGGHTHVCGLAESIYHTQHSFQFCTYLQVTLLEHYVTRNTATKKIHKNS